MKTKDKIITIPDFMYALIVIKDNPGLSIIDLFKKSKISYAHLHQIKRTLIEKEWIRIEKVEKKHKIFLTVTGDYIYEALIQLLNTMNITTEEIYNYKLQQKKIKEVETYDEDE